MNAFCIHGSRNGSYAFRNAPEPWTADSAFYATHQELTPDMSGNSRPGLRRCEACGELLDKWNELLTGLVVKKRKLDLSSTYDGVKTASERFKTAYESAGLSGLKFYQLPDDPQFYAIRPDRAVDYNADRRGTRFIKPCPKCGCYESVVGATPVYLKPGSAIKPNEFVRTDLEFGSEDEKSPLLLCGESAAAALQAANLKGIDFEVI